MAVAHFAFYLGFCYECRDRVDNDNIDGARANESLGYLKRLLSRIGLGNEQGIDIDPLVARVDGIERMLDINKRRRSALLLRLCDTMERDGRFTRGFGTVDLDDPSFRYTAYPERHIKGQRSRTDMLNIH